MGYIYAAMWLFAGVLLLIRYRRLSRMITPLSIYLMLLGIWWLVNEFTETDLLHGVFAWILRGITAVVLAVCAIIYYSEKRNTANDQSEQSADKDD